MDAITLTAPPTDVEPSDIELSIVMPCLNEAETLAICIEKANRFLATSGVAGEVVIADNGSTDGSQDIARSLGARVVDVPARGYGAALQAGIIASHGRFVAMGDSDDSYDFEGLMPFVLKLREGYELVMGNRFQGGIKPGAMPPLHRYLGNPVLSFAGRLFYDAPIGDFHCGLRAFRRDSIMALGLRTTGMEFASEMVVKATLAHIRMAEVPTTLSPDGRSRPPHLRSWRDGWRHLKFLLTFAPKWLFFYPGAALAGIGLVLLIALLPGSLRLGSVTLGVHTLLFAAAGVIIGAQLMSFAVVARLFGVRERLWPTSPRIELARTWFSIDRTCVAGAIMLLAGIVIAAVALGGWAGTGFRDMNVEGTMRLAIPSVLLCALGVQALVTGFFTALLTSD
ncbi:glycosyltransferase family 2 protein [Polymorphobacter sp. PAMC 29334]|uniref:glycosyltransferase family 2 protein n=1 Tax=Polymorphobacter sp. PAMC 29334 TaxID=2862331 RepID=UPI001C66DFE1|nr:glycosyltransferase family 2 protein [Polymorphobacter sp. PAMC 29334]QYE35320.1 glycosyltransferase family 2 protein [Polymorphobacter sp. PAMC 29334]